jgi:hypothetical protein
MTPGQDLYVAQKVRQAHRELDWLLAVWCSQQPQPMPSELSVFDLSRWAIDYAKELESFSR